MQLAKTRGKSCVLLEVKHAHLVAIQLHDRYEIGE